MVLIGLTGGVGMGKTTAARTLEARGVPVLDTDQIARDLVAPGEPALTEIKTRFGNGIIGPDGQLRRRELAQIVFHDPTARRQLEDILHPRIRERWLLEAQAWRNQRIAAGCVVIPLLFETSAESEFDQIVCVACTEFSQHLRLRERNWSETEIKSRISAQMPVEEKLRRAHYVIWTEGGVDLIPAQWDLITAQLLQPRPAG